jgi:hypothetical protein
MQWLVSDDPVRARKGHGAFDDVFGTQSAIGSQYLDALVVRSPGTRSAVLRHSQRWRSSSSPIRRPVTITGAALVRENGLGPFFG